MERITWRIGDRTEISVDVLFPYYSKSAEPEGTWFARIASRTAAEILYVGHDGSFAMHHRKEWFAGTDLTRVLGSGAHRCRAEEFSAAVERLAALGSSAQAETLSGGHVPPGMAARWPAARCGPTSERG